VPTEPGVQQARAPEAWTQDGMRVLDVPDVRSALRLLNLVAESGSTRPPRAV
jgi:DNA repair protein RadA/Sms